MERLGKSAPTVVLTEEEEGVGGVGFKYAAKIAEREIF